jgi:histidinol-phosphatase (PHP family)
MRRWEDSQLRAQNDLNQGFYRNLTDYHIHSPLCKHAAGEPWEYALVAFELGMAEIGMSDHIPMPDRWDHEFRMDLDQWPLYLEKVAEARSRVPRLTIRQGVEADWAPEYASYLEKFLAAHPFDYVLGSVHRVGDWGVDSPLGKQGVLPGPHVDDLWRVYFQAWTGAVESGLYDVMAHPDLVKIHGQFPSGDLRRFYEPALESCAKGGVALEVSTAGLERPVKEIYPGNDFLRCARALNIPIVINSDAHQPKHVGRHFTAAVRWAWDAGYRELVRFEGRRARYVPLTLPKELV